MRAPQQHVSHFSFSCRYASKILPRLAWCDYIVGDDHACPKDTFSPYRVAQRKKNGEEISRLQDGFTMLDLETDMPQEADPESLSEDWALYVSLLVKDTILLIPGKAQKSSFICLYVMP
jgi:hypothetical protein